MPEPSILDYLKALLGGRPRPEVPALPKGKVARVASKRTPTPRTGSLFKFNRLPWRSGLAFLLFLIAQRLWSQPHDTWLPGILLGLIAVGLTIWAARFGEWRMPEAEAEKSKKQTLILRREPLMFALLFFGLTFLFSGGNRFNFINVTFWLLSIIFTLIAFWQSNQRPRAAWNAFRERFSQREWTLNFSRWALLVLFVFALAAFFRFSQLESIPPEMTSDHAEKLLDVYDVVNGQTSIFFTRNSGREPLQFYLTAAVADIFGTGVSFLSLKLGTVILAFISLIYTYLLGKEIGGRWVGLFALFFTGLGYWPNLLARTALRFSLYPTFAAPVLYYLLRGLRRGSLNDFLLSGLFLGIGLHGYTSFRIMPFVAIAAVLIYLLHKAKPEMRKRAVIGLTLLALVSLVVFTPLIRYAIDNPGDFAFRMTSRMFESERAYPGSALLIFPMNVLRALGMFNYSGGNIWLVGLVERPAFDLISAALLLLGVVLVGIRYWRQRRWQDLFLLLALPLLMLPSSLSIAFPEENPAMNRASGAWIPAFILCAIALDALLHGLREKLGGKTGLRLAQGLGVLILILFARSNYNLFFKEYAPLYGLYSWNTSELGRVIADYSNTFGTRDSAWVVAFPHWVDTRLVGMNAGYIEHDYAIAPDQLSNTLVVAPPKLFLLQPADGASLDALRQLYPEGLYSLHTSAVPSKEFGVFFVPAQESDQ
jgi:hypothetical protein